ncbi:hypothetical protein [Terasakiella sp. SH-1]|uniref:hypothetical protein n=1 Tax=Terasakiella sp. SH-1 TaxID=2560057 RepID=UPI001073BDDB|nr:hypothetical protein [Terasakiella sp. SH-1]
MLGLLLFSPSIVSIFDRGGEAVWFGVPVLLIYLFGAWAVLIGIAAILVIRRQKEALPPLELDGED